MSLRTFPLALAALFISFQLMTTGLFAFRVPAGQVWLGSTAMNAADAPVYLSIIAQMSRGDATVQTLDVNEPTRPRSYPHWLPVGLLVRMGMPMVWAYELFRYAGAVGLVFALYAAARATFSGASTARLACILAAAGISSGWFLHWACVTNVLPSRDLPIPDLMTEFSLAPVLLSGGNVICSAALLIAGLCLLWRRVGMPGPRVWAAPIIILACLLVIHPYLVPLCGTFYVMAVLWNTSGSVWDLRRHAFHALAVLPAAITYGPLVLDPSFRAHHVVTNELPLYPWYGWPIVLFPFLCAGVWRYRRRLALRKEEEWLIAWALAAVLCLFLPVPWKRKLTEALIVPCVFLTMPAWEAMYTRVRGVASGVLRWSCNIGLGLLSAMGPLYLIGALAYWSVSPVMRSQFYVPSPVMAVWRHLESTAPRNAVIAADSLPVMAWGPAYTVRRTWIGHPHDTPAYRQKRTAWQELLMTTSTSRADTVLEEGRVTHLIATSVSSTQRYEHVLGPAGWQKTYQDEGVSVFEKTLR